MAKGYSSGLLTGLLIGAASALLIAGKKSGVKNDIASGANVIKEKTNEVFGVAKAKLTNTRATDDDNVEELLADETDDIKSDAEDALEATIDDAEEVAAEINDAKNV